MKEDFMTAVQTNLSVYPNSEVLTPPTVQAVNEAVTASAVTEPASLKPEVKEDTFELSAKQEQVAPPKISTLRLAVGLLTDEQIQQINETGKLPENAKFIPNGMGGYTIRNNFFGVTSGTQQLPQGFEVKNNLFGFSQVVPKGTQGVFLKENNQAVAEAK